MSEKVVRPPKHDTAAENARRRLIELVDELLGLEFVFGCRTAEKHKARVRGLESLIEKRRA